MDKFYGLIGKSLVHSMSPIIQQKIMERINVKGTYSLFEIDQDKIGDVIKGLSALKCGGLNVTIPYKLDVMEHLDSISPEAKKIGAVNTVEFKDGKTRGYNTDYHGFKRTLETANIPMKGQRAVILGTGGASRAVRQCLLDNGVIELLFVSRTPRQELLDGCKVIDYDALAKLEGFDMMVNCTPSGMYPHMDACPVEEATIKKFSTAIDLIYNPSKTQFLSLAEKHGLKTANGLYMLIAQAVAAQEIWQGFKIDDNKVTGEIYDELK